MRPQVVKLELLAKENTPSIRMVWEQYHQAGDGKLGIVLEEATWQRFREKAKSKCVSRHKTMRARRTCVIL